MGVTINRRREMGGSNLSYAYKVEYLASTGEQWIDTDYRAYETQCKLEVNITTFSGGWCGANGSLQLRCTYANGITNALLSIERTDSSNCITRLSDDVKEITSYAPDNSKIILFGLGYRNGVVANLSKYLLHKAVYKVNGNIVRDFIPVVDKQGVPAMYDKVSGQLFYNQGTGQFIAGPRVSGGQ